MMTRRFDPVMMVWARDLGRKYKKPKRGDVEQDARKASATDQARSIASQDTAQGTLNQFEGPVDKSPFYKSLLKAGTEGTANAYQSAKANTAARAKTAGFGYAQPVAQGAQDQIGAEEAKAQSRVPGEALVQASGPALTAAGETAQIGATQGAQGEGYMTGAAVPLESQYQDMMAKRRAALGKAIGMAAGGIAGGPAGATIGGDIGGGF